MNIRHFIRDRAVRGIGAAKIRELKFGLRGGSIRRGTLSHQIHSIVGVEAQCHLSRMNNELIARLTGLLGFVVKHSVEDVAVEFSLE